MAGPNLPSFHGIIGRSAPMQALFERIKKFAPPDVSVLIQGETGTGKELVATAIHRLSTRDRVRLMTVNCGALTRELLLSELFGHERGAFTGAVVRKRGLLAVADGGTVFLDEIGDLPLDAQVMLLRFLQNGEVRPVGSTETGRVDVRVIAATHRDLAGAVEDGAFRADLYYRLHRFVLTIPPLRARREDVPLLVEHFRAQLNARHHLSCRASRDQGSACSSSAHGTGTCASWKPSLSRRWFSRAPGGSRPRTSSWRRCPAKEPPSRSQGRGSTERQRARPR